MYLQYSGFHTFIFHLNIFSNFLTIMFFKLICASYTTVYPVCTIAYGLKDFIRYTLQISIGVYDLLILESLNVHLVNSNPSFSQTGIRI